MTARSLPPLLPALLALAACTADAPGETEGPDTTGTSDMSPTTGEPPALLDLDAPCDFGRDDADELALVTVAADFSAAGLARVDVVERRAAPEVAPASTDTVLGAHGDWLVMVHRFGFNRLELVDRKTGWSVVGGEDVTYPGVDEPNPQSVAFTDDGLAWVPLFAAPSVQIFDFTQSSGWKVGEVDLAPFADADGSPEAGLALACGGVVFVAIQRLDTATTFAPVDKSYLVAIDAAARAPIDLDPATDGPQAIALLGPWPKQFRRDPADLMGHTALVLTSGVERVDLSRGTSEWAVPPEAIAAAGAPQAFALAPDGASVYLAVTDASYSKVSVVQLGLDGAAPAAPTLLVETEGVGDRMLEQLGGVLWIGDRGGSRLRAWDLAQAPPAELESEDLGTDVPPWTFLALP